jgi:hypothetical protein
MTQKYKYDEKTNSYIPIDDEEKKPSDEKLIAIIIWAANFLLPFVSGIIAYIYYENKNEFLRNTGKESLNYGISFLIYTVIVSISFFAFVGIILAPILTLYYIVIPILGILNASENKIYRPHFTIRFIK